MAHGGCRVFEAVFGIVLKQHCWQSHLLCPAPHVGHFRQAVCSSILAFAVIRQALLAFVVHLYVVLCCMRALEHSCKVTLVMPGGTPPLLCMLAMLVVLSDLVGNFSTLCRYSCMHEASAASAVGIDDPYGLFWHGQEPVGMWKI